MPFKYLGPERLLDNALPEITQLILSNAATFHNTFDNVYSEISDYWRTIYKILLKVKTKKHINLTEYKDLQSASCIADFLDPIMVHFRSTTNSMILNAAKNRFANKSSHVSTQFSTLLVIDENKEDEQKNIAHKRF